jgi:hypothetical protein
MMYARIVAGEFGNTLPRWIGPDQFRPWVDAARPANAPVLWGVQHTTIAGFPGTKLNVPTAQVLDTITHGGFGDDFCISPMITSLPGLATRWEGDVTRHHETGAIYCSGNTRPAPGSWRTHMKAPRLWEGSAALLLLRTVLNENSFDDLMTLLDDYPGHVVELSATDKCYGTHPGRSAIIWEVRAY